MLAGKTELGVVLRMVQYHDCANTHLRTLLQPRINQSRTDAYLVNSNRMPLPVCNAAREMPRRASKYSPTRVNSNRIVSAI